MITRRGFLGASAAVGAGLIAGCAGRTGSDGGAGMGRPNVIVIMADDLGFECLGCYGGSSYKTPNLDAFAATGMRFKYCFTSPVCSPSRAQLLTGRYTFRTGFVDIAGRNGAVDMLDPKKEVTLAQVLRKAGYATAISGKWHLGWGSRPTTGPAEYDPKRYAPSSNIAACGFDEQYCFSTSHISYGPPIQGQYHPDLYHDWAMKYLEGRKGEAQPFFLYYALGLPHFDFDPTPLNPDGKKKDRANFPYMVQYLDQQVGQIVRKVEELGMRENTLILFMADNGTDGFTSEINGRKLKGKKQSVNDAGVWAPLLASWPGVIGKGTYCQDLTDLTDLLPTIVDMAGAKMLKGPPIDGRSFAAQLRGQAGNPRQWIYTQLVNKWFIRDKRWKLRENGELYDVSDSPFEEKLVKPESQTAEAQAARERLSKALAELRREA